MNRDDVRYLARRMSLSLIPAAHSVWIHGEVPSQFDAARRTLQLLAEGRPDLCLLYSSTNPATIRYLDACFPNDQASPVPLSSNLVIRRFFRIVKPRLFVLLEGGRTVDKEVLLHAFKAGLPIVLTNVGSDVQINPLLVDQARSSNYPIRFCVQDRRDAKKLEAASVSSRRITITGSLDLEPARPSQQVPRAAVRRLLGVHDATPLIVAGPVPPREEDLLLDAFGEIKQWKPLARLILEPTEWRRRTSVFDRIRQQGWRALRRTSPKPNNANQAWDVLLAEVPGELPALFRAADVAIAGGTFSEPNDPGSLATALGAGCSVVAGREHLTSTFRPPPAEGNRLLAAKASGLGAALLQALQAPSGDAETEQPHAAQQPHRGAATRTAQVLLPLLPKKSPPGPEGPSWSVPTFRDSIADGPIWGAAAPWFMRRRINDWETLHERLQRPRSVLCLGNGPSSEDPRLMKVDHDCLMRVNWRWGGRNFLTRPHVVFIGDFATVHRVSHCLFAIWNEFLEQRMLLRRLTRRGPRRIEYITMARMPGVTQARRWTTRPSNGALMIVAAAALQPERITIGGMDLFEHPAGRYPHDIRTRNEYARAHTRENELAMIDLALRDFQGELIILSDILRDSLRQYRESQHGEAVSAGSLAL